DIWAFLDHAHKPLPHRSLAAAGDLSFVLGDRTFGRTWNGLVQHRQTFSRIVGTIHHGIARDDLVVRDRGLLNQFADVFGFGLLGGASAEKKVRVASGSSANSGDLSFIVLP